MYHSKNNFYWSKSSLNTVSDSRGMVWACRTHILKMSKHLLEQYFLIQYFTGKKAFFLNYKPHELLTTSWYIQTTQEYGWEKNMLNIRLLSPPGLDITRQTHSPWSQLNTLLSTIRTLFWRDFTTAQFYTLDRLYKSPQSALSAVTIEIVALWWLLHLGHRKYG